MGKPNPQNLKVPTSEEARRNGAKGGKASGEARRRRKTMKDLFEQILMAENEDPASAKGLKRLGYEETDIWYVLTHRKRLMRQVNTKIHNHIIYYVIDKYADVGKNELLKAMDVEVAIIPSQNTEEDTNIKLFEELKAKIGTRQV